MQDNPYLLPGAETQRERLSRMERRMGGMMLDEKLAGTRYGELPESASVLGARRVGNYIFISLQSWMPLLSEL